jgi:hypothetical protein
MTADRDDFDAFYTATARRVLHHVYAVAGDVGDAQDAVQEAYARAWQRWSRVSGGVGPPGGQPLAGHPPPAGRAGPVGAAGMRTGAVAGSGGDPRRAPAAPGDGATDLVAYTDPRTLRVSFVVTLAGRRDFARVKAQLEQLPGVDEVIAEPR